MSIIGERYTIGDVSGTLIGFKNNKQIAIIFDGYENHDIDLRTIERVVNIETKVCSDCGKNLSLEHFTKMRGEKLRSQCKDCFAERISKGKEAKKNQELPKVKEYVETKIVAKKQNLDVIRPKHYSKENGVDNYEKWYLTYEWDQFVSMMEGVADRYITRHRYKNGIEDLEKAMETLRRLKEYHERRNKESGK